jgi:arylformamidase
VKIIDVSWPITAGTTAYKDKSVVRFDVVSSFLDGDTSREQNIYLSSHTGTHIDAPAHFIKDGKTLDQLGLEPLVGRCKILDLTTVEQKITAEVLQKKERELSLEPGDIVLFKTTNSDVSPTDKFISNFVYLTHDGAQYLCDKKIKAVGIDYLGIEQSHPDHPTHMELLRRDIPIIEGLRLKETKQGIFFFCCLPLSMPGLEAAPARAMIIEGL